MRSASSCEAWLKQNSSLFLFFGRGRGFYLRSACSYEQSEVERRPFLSQALSNPTARERLLHCVQVYLALSRRKCKFDIFKIRVSVDKILRLNF